MLGHGLDDVGAGLGAGPQMMALFWLNQAEILFLSALMPGHIASATAASHCDSDHQIGVFSGGTLIRWY